jgi:gliding motility-associated-like protein
MRKLTDLKRIVFSIALLICIQARTFAQSFQWAERMGGNDLDIGYNIKTDSAGNSYVTGSFTGPAYFGAYTLPGIGNSSQMFLAKYNQAGTCMWVRSDGNAAGSGVGLDYNSNVYVTGSGFLISKYDSSGNFQWSIPPPANSPGGYSLVVDRKNNVYIAGFFSSDVTFASTTLNCIGIYDIFVVKYDEDGNFQWVQQYGTPEVEDISDMAVDDFGNVFIIGRTRVSPSWEIFTAKYNTSGTQMWMKKSVGKGFINESQGIAVDKKGNVFITGLNSDTIDFDGITINGQACFLCKYDSTGNILFAKATNSLGNPARMRVDSHGSPYIFGVWNNYTHASIGRFDSACNLLNVKKMSAAGPNGSDIGGASFSFDFLDNIYFTGLYGNPVAGTSYTAVFDSIVLHEMGGMDGFLAKLENFYGNTSTHNNTTAVEIFIPNLITPNDDGRNDKFVLRGLGDTVQVKIYNSWGSLIFESNQYENNWDGQGMPDEIVFYQITSTSSQKYKGWLHILN